MGDSVKSLAEVKLDNIHCSPLIYPASHVIIGGYLFGEHDFHLVNPCRPFLITFSSTCLKMTSRINSSITFPGMEMWLIGLQFPGSFFLTIFKTGVTLSSLQLSGTFPVLHDPSKMIESGLVMTSASTFSTQGCITSGPMALWVSSLLK